MLEEWLDTGAGRVRLALFGALFATIYVYVTGMLRRRKMERRQLLATFGVFFLFIIVWLTFFFD